MRRSLYVLLGEIGQRQETDFADDLLRHVNVRRNRGSRLQERIAQRVGFFGGHGESFYLLLLTS